MDHLFCSCVCHALILVPASLRDLHRRSCRHFHFSFLAFLAPSYPHFVSQWISFLSSPPSRARAPLYIFRLLALFSFLHVLLSFFFISVPFFLERAFSFLATQWNMRARVRHGERAVPRSSIFRESSSSLRPLWGVSSSETLREREREDFLSTAPWEIDELPRDRTGEKRTSRRNVKFRELIRSIESVSEVTRRALSKARPPPFSSNWQKSICLLPRKLGHQLRVLIKTG